MTQTEWIFLDPVDVLHLRGNRQFGAPGSFGAAQMPPWPSLVSGALRARILAASGAPLTAIRDGALPDSLAAVLTPELGSFRLAALLGGERRQGRIAPLLALPADLVWDAAGAHLLRPEPLPVRTSAPLPALPVLTAAPAKPRAGGWLREAGIRAWLAGRAPAASEILPSADLWATDLRPGIARDAATGTAADGALFSSEAVAPRPPWVSEGHGFGFLAGIQGAGGLLHATGLLRLGGDGRAAAVAPAAAPPAPDYAALAAARRFRLLLLTPGLFAGGWRLPGLEADGRWAPPGAGFTARLAAAAVPRAAVVSGWDLARQQPKPAWRAAPAGSVYWLDQYSGDAAALERLAAAGLPCDLPVAAERRAEGFNSVWLAAWPQGGK
jgi:CRISPR-associated protein Cmr3